MTSSHQSIRIIQVTDTHLYANPEHMLNGINPDLTLRRVVKYLTTSQPDTSYFIASGDLAHDGSEKAYARLKTILHALGRPVLCLPGNHDDAATFRSVLNDELLHCPRAVICGNWQLIFLDSTVPEESSGHLDGQELEFLERRLRQDRKLHTLIILHHHPLPVGSEWMDRMKVDNGADLISLIHRHPQVHAVMWGHVHQVFDRIRNGIRYLASPSTCVQFKPETEQFTLDDKPPGFRWLDLHSDGSLDTGVVWVGM